MTAPRTTAPQARRVPASFSPAPPPAPAPADTRDDDPNARLFLFLVLFAAFVILAGLAIDGLWWGRLWDTFFYAVPCGTTAILLGGIRTRASLRARLLVPVIVAAFVFYAIAVGEPTLVTVETYFLLFLPAWGAVAVLGTARYRWDAARTIGATLVLIAVWRPLHGSFPDLTQLLRAAGVFEPYSVFHLYRIVAAKFLHELTFAVVGLFLLFGRFPFVQTRPAWGRDAKQVLLGIDGGLRRNLWIDLGLGATTLLLALGGSYGLSLLADLFPPVGGQGADDSRLYANITPLLVLLLSLAAGVGEELLFRAILQTWFERSFRSVLPGRTALPILLAVLLQAFLFGVVHAGYANLVHVLLPFGFGLLTGLAYRYWGLLPVVYAHVGIDVFAFGFDAATNWFPGMGGFLTVFFYLNVVVGLLTPIYLVVEWFSERSRRALAASAE